jgi:hypothetical protein
VPKFALLGHLGGAGVRDGCAKSTKNRAHILCSSYKLAFKTTRWKFEYFT